MNFYVESLLLRMALFGPHEDEEMPRQQEHASRVEILAIFAARRSRSRH